MLGLVEMFVGVGGLCFSSGLVKGGKERHHIFGEPGVEIVSLSDGIVGISSHSWYDWKWHCMICSVNLWGWYMQ